MRIQAIGDHWLEGLGDEFFIERLNKEIEESLKTFKDDAGSTYTIEASSNEAGNLIYEMKRDRKRTKPFDKNAENKTAKNLMNIIDMAFQQTMKETMGE